MEDKIINAEAEEVVEEVAAEETVSEEAVAEESTTEEVVTEDTAAQTEEQTVEAAEEAATSDFTEYEISGLTPAQRKRKEIIDKITTGILILLMASPVLILAYIFLWFIFR